MTLSDRIAVSQDVIARDVGGETVLLHLDSGTYFGLNAVGGRIWQMLDSASATVGDLATAITEEFDVSQAEAEADILDLARNLLDQGLVDVVEA